MFRFSADNHPLQIIEADGTGVNGRKRAHLAWR